MKMLFRVWLVMVLCVSPLHAGQTVLEVIPLKYRGVQEVLPVLQPFIGKDGALSGMNGQLIVRDTPENLARIREILGKIDTLPRRLRILVRQGQASEAQEQGAEISGEARAGDVRLKSPARGSGGATVESGGARARVWSSGAKGEETISQEVRVLEGQQAFIRLGMSVPVREAVVVQGGVAGNKVVETTAYKEISTGFHVVPRLSGDRVTLEIAARRERLGDSKRPTIETQGVTTSVSGHLGEWIDLGGLTESNADGETGWVYGTRRMAKDERRVWVKVEEVP